MYDTHGIGLRIAQKRKARGLTQENLAEILGISAQAVSKWETGLGFPDLTLLPSLAAALDTSIDELFGRPAAPAAGDAAAKEARDPVFPDRYDGLDRIAVFKRCAVFADTGAKMVDGAVVTFPDGSEADLATHTVTNRGRQRIIILCEDELDAVHATKSDKREEHDSAAYKRYTFDLAGLVKVRLVRAKEGQKGGWKADGHPSFMRALQIEQNEDTFAVRVEQFKNSLLLDWFRPNDGIGGELTVYVPADCVDELDLIVRGATTFISEAEIGKSRIEINGGATLTLVDAGELDLLVNGAGTLTAGHAKNASMTVNGSAKIKLDDMSGNAFCKLSGAGTFNLKGNLQTLKIDMNGAGKLNGDMLQVENLQAVMGGVSSAVIGRVRGQSVERVAQMSRLTVLERG